MEAEDVISDSRPARAAFVCDTRSSQMASAVFQDFSLPAIALITAGNERSNLKRKTNFILYIFYNFILYYFIYFILYIVGSLPIRRRYFSNLHRSKRKMSASPSYPFGNDRIGSSKFKIKVETLCKCSLAIIGIYMI